MLKNIEHRFGELEYRESEDGLGVVSGRVLRYGDVATLPWGTEEFKSGPFEYAKRGLRVNRMHVRQQPLARTGVGLKVEDTAEQLRTEFQLPDTAAGRDADTELRLGLLTGLSVEFRVLKDEVDEKGHRLITRAILYGFGLVDDPAYPDSLASMRGGWTEYRSAHGLEEPPEPAHVHAYVIDQSTGKAMCSCGLRWEPQPEPTPKPIGFRFAQ